MISGQNLNQSLSLLQSELKSTSVKLRMLQSKVIGKLYVCLILINRLSFLLAYASFIGYTEYDRPPHSTMLHSVVNSWHRLN